MATTPSSTSKADWAACPSVVARAAAVARNAIADTLLSSFEVSSPVVQGLDGGCVVAGGCRVHGHERLHRLGQQRHAGWWASTPPTSQQGSRRWRSTPRWPALLGVVTAAALASELAGAAGLHAYALQSAVDTSSEVGSKIAAMRHMNSLSAGHAQRGAK